MFGGFAEGTLERENDWNWEKRHRRNSYRSRQIFIQILISAFYLDSMELREALSCSNNVQKLLLDHLPFTLVQVVVDYNVKSSLHAELFKWHVVREMKKTQYPYYDREDSEYGLALPGRGIEPIWFQDYTTEETRLYFSHFRSEQEFGENWDWDVDTDYLFAAYLDEWRHGRWRRPV